MTYFPPTMYAETVRGILTNTGKYAIMMEPGQRHAPHFDLFRQGNETSRNGGIT